MWVSGPNRPLLGLTVQRVELSRAPARDTRIRPFAPGNDACAGIASRAAATAAAMHERTNLRVPHYPAPAQASQVRLGGARDPPDRWPLGDRRRLWQAPQCRVHVFLGELRVFELTGEVGLVSGHVEVAVTAEVEQDRPLLA